MYAVLGTATGLKLLCYVLCVALQSKSGAGRGGAAMATTMYTWPAAGFFWFRFKV
jgi:hypothetical protein